MEFSIVFFNLYILLPMMHGNNNLSGSPKSSSCKAASCKQHLHKSDKIIRIAGLFEMGGSSHASYGSSELDTARLAIENVNEARFLLPYRLELVAENTKCDTAQAIDSLYKMKYTYDHLNVVLGPSCSPVAETIALVIQAENLVQISFGATNPQLSEREKYKTFFRLCESDSSHNSARIEFLRHFNWDKVAFVVEDDPSFKLSANIMQKEFQSFGIKVTWRADFKKNNIQEKLLSLKENGARIIFGKFHETIARELFCEVYHLGLFGRKFVWILPKMYSHQWWLSQGSTNCSSMQMDLATYGYFTVDSLSTVDRIDEETQTGSKQVLTVSKFLEIYDQRNFTMPKSPYVGYAYDAIWTIALGFANIINEHPSAFSNQTLLSDIFMETIPKINFEGLSGHVSFKGSDRVGSSAIFQRHGKVLRRIAMAEETNQTNLNFFCMSCYPVLWEGNSSSVPVDEVTITFISLTITRGVFFVACMFCTLGCILSIAFLAFNFYFRHLKYIKLSSPTLNNVAVLGCILIYVTVIVWGLDDRLLKPHHYNFLCPIRVIAFPAGLTIQFGAMFAKTFRVYIIFRGSYRGVIKNKLLRDTQLLLIIAVLSGVDIILTTAWCIFDPLSRKLTNLTDLATTSDIHGEVLIIPQLVTCNSAHTEIWTGIFCLYFGSILVFGVYMVWSIRHVHIPVLNDSKFIGFCVYNVVLSSVLVFVLFLILNSQLTQWYIISASVIVISTTATVLLLFLPKVYDVVKAGGNPIVHTSMTFHESGCKTLTTIDDVKEKYDRAKIRNRVFRNELIHLQNECQRLENLLTSPIEPYRAFPTELLDQLPEDNIDRTFNTDEQTFFSGTRTISDEDLVTYCTGHSGCVFTSAEEQFQRDEKKMSPAQPRRLSMSAGWSKIQAWSRLRKRFSFGNACDVSAQNRFEPSHLAPLTASPPLSPSHISIVDETSSIDVTKSRPVMERAKAERLQRIRQEMWRVQEELSKREDSDICVVEV